ncbi:hypothetical protein GUJ93_ZPchr0008g13664 [Zizania palustris]|uniref:Uncharacterized protein n=1 Tax=Zizania palustris TaxID=103762 RepID=A0A8J5R3G7_ZIZPA|nr:hypothetical protein GUJ93_ZPchr0008g13664 [Zizania palustris]
MAPPERQQGAGGGGESDSGKEEAAVAGGVRYGRWCLSGLELSVNGPGPLSDVDDGRLKNQIKRWAKAVVALARQISFGSPRAARSRSSSSRRGDGRAAFPSKSGVRDANNDDPAPAP